MDVEDIVDPTEPEDQVDVYSAQLIGDFRKFYEDCLEEHPEWSERRTEVFESWVIQKIAGLQLSVMQIAKDFRRHADK